MGRSLSNRNHRRDDYHRRAKQQGFRARAVFKLDEIDSRLHLLKPGGHVLDLGCCPGSWLQYSAGKVGPKGKLVGIDCLAVDPPIANTRHILGDVLEISASELLGELSYFDVVLSDMAPNTSGIRHVDQARSELLFERALDLACRTLCVRGHFVGKLFQGPAFSELVTRCRATFDKVKIIKPSGSRSQSIEQYVVGLGFRAPAHTSDT